MKIPEDKKIFDNGLSFLWWGKEGVLFSLSKKGIPLTKTNLENAFEIISKLAGGEKICFIADMTLTSQPENKEAYDFAIEKMTELFKAHAMIASSPMSKMIANLYLHIKKLPYPAKIFTSEIDALEWLRQFE